MAEYEQAVPPDLRNETYTGEVLAMLHLVEGRPAEAAAAARLQTSPCALCGIAELARAHDAAGAADSAIAAWRRYVDTPATDRLGFDVSELAIAYERLGQLHDERGDRTEAARFYAKLVELWADSDPVLQPRVEAARRRLAEITADRG